MATGLLGLVGCTTEDVCAPGLIRESGRCVADCVNGREELERTGRLGECDDVDMGPDSDADVGPTEIGMDVPDLGPCGDACTGDTPLCDESAARCVQCLAPTDCASVSGRPMCDDGTCVECTSSDQCTEATASRCADSGLEAGSCAPCVTSTDCAGIMDGEAALGVCDDRSGTGICVQCTEATAEADCDEFSCDPATSRCTETERGTVDRCESCTGDGECQDGLGCIAIEELGGTNAYCMPLLPESGVCPNVYRVLLEDVVTLSGASPADYCTFPLATFACSGVLSIDTACSDDEPRCPGGAQCETIPGSGEVCTIACSVESNCPEIAPFNTCGGDGYCGS
ncbi:MAG: hypothetical protein AAF938_05325 [Myxococcota bacterium]